MNRAEVRVWGWIAASAAASVVFYHLSVAGIFCLLPLALLSRRFGFRALVTASLLSALLALVWTTVWQRVGGLPWSVWDSLDVALPVVLIAGWLGIEALRAKNLRFVVRLGLVLTVAGVVGFPVLASLMANPTVLGAWKVGFAEAWTQIAQAGGPEMALAVTPEFQNLFFEMSKQSVLGGFLPVLMVLWGLTESWSRAIDKNSTKVRWEDFHMPSESTIPFLLIGAVFLVRALWGGAASPASSEMIWWSVLTNIALVLWIGYAWHGWGVLSALMIKWRFSRGIRWLMSASMVLLVLSAGPLSLVVMIGLPLLAVLELWIDFRKIEQRG